METEFFLEMLDPDGAILSRFDVDGDQDCAEAQMAAFSPPPSATTLRLIRRAEGWRGSEVAVRVVMAEKLEGNLDD